MRKWQFWLAAIVAAASLFPPPVASAAVDATPSTGQQVFPFDQGYRYGPSFIVNSDGSINMWTCSNGNLDQTYANYSASGNHDPVQLTGSDVAAEEFTAPYDFRFIEVTVPTWQTSNASITLSLYRWNTDYGTTISGTPVATQTFSNVQDNSNLQLSFPSVKSGTYLWAVSNPQNTIGVWKYDGSSMPGNVNFFNGQQTTGDYQMTIGYYNWDVIRESVSTNGGQSFGNETIALAPTPGGDDNYSTCDPGVVEFGGYYYIGYTSTMDDTGTDNDVFVARGTSPTGPWQKWNGSGWGGNPVPFITYNGPSYTYGYGEPSFLVLNGTLYIYFTDASVNASGAPSLSTDVATAPTSNPNWPGDLTFQGTAISKVGPNQDSSDVKYDDALGKFLAVNTVQRFGPKATVQLWESDNGLSFYPANMNPDNLLPYLNNDGLSGDAQGHIETGQPTFLGYAYGSQWANWATYINPITITSDSLPASPMIYSVVPENGSAVFTFQTNPQASSYVIRYGTSPGQYTQSVTGITSSPYTLTGLSNGTRYFFVMDAVNAKGTSADSEPASATPLDYQPVKLLNAVAATQLSNDPATNVINGNFQTFYSSDGFTSPTNPQWIYVDAGSNQEIARLVITPRQPYPFSAPSLGVSAVGQGDAGIQVSNDAVNWFPVPYTQVGGVIDFWHPVSARYIRYYTQYLAPDNYGNYYLQIAQIQAYSVPETAIASSSISGWGPANMLDLDPNTVYSSDLSTTNATQWAGLDLGYPESVAGLSMVPRPGGYCFPVDFVIQSSDDGITWTDIPGQSYTNYPTPGNSTQTFSFPSPVTARYFRVYATQLSKDNNGNYALQFAQMFVRRSIPFTAAASSSLPAAPASNLEDGDPNTIWSSDSHTTPDAVESVTLDMGSDQTVRDLRLIPRSGYCFPSSFSISYSTDGTNWTQVPGQSYTNFINPGEYSGIDDNPSQLMWFSSPITARYLKIIATVLTPDQYGNYYFQLADVFIDA